MSEMKLKHQGFFHSRLNLTENNEREVTFAEFWRAENADSNVLRHLIPNVTQRDAQVAATVIQWLGSNVGTAFLRRAVRNNANIAEWLKE